MPDKNDDPKLTLTNDQREVEINKLTKKLIMVINADAMEGGFDVREATYIAVIAGTQATVTAALGNLSEAGLDELGDTIIKSIQKGVESTARQVIEALKEYRQTGQLPPELKRLNADDLDELPVDQRPPKRSAWDED